MISDFQYNPGQLRLICIIGERVGCTFFVTKSPQVAQNCESTLERLQRSEISNPPAYGAKLASEVLNNGSLRAMWYDDLVMMSSRVAFMRESLHNLLVESGMLERSLFTHPR